MHIISHATDNERQCLLELRTSRQAAVGIVVPSPLHIMLPLLPQMAACGIVTTQYGDVTQAQIQHDLSNLHL